MAKMSKRKQNLISIIILVVGTAVSFLIFGPNKSHSQADPESFNQKPVAKVKTMRLSEEISSKAQLEKTAMFQSTKSSKIVVEYSGNLKSVDFEVGEFVSEGQVIASFDQSPLENSAKSSLDSAQESLVLALNNLDKTKDLTDESLEIAKNSRKIAEIQLDQAEDDGDDDAIELAERNLENAKDLEDQAEESQKLQINGAQQQVNQARLNVQQAQVAYENTIVKAPIDGLIVAKNVKQEQFVNFGDKIGEIVGVGKLETTISLNKDQIERVQVGDEVKVIFEVDELGAEIVTLSPVANASNQRYDVKIQTLDELSGRANMSGKVLLDLTLDSKTQNFFIPLEAVNIGQKKTVVFVVIDEQATSKEIEIGEVIGTQVEVIAGLGADDEVVISNSRNLQEGQQIEREN